MSLMVRRAGLIAAFCALALAAILALSRGPLAGFCLRFQLVNHPIFNQLFDPLRGAVFASSSLPETIGNSARSTSVYSNVSPDGRFTLYQSDEETGGALNYVLFLSETGALNFSAVKRIADNVDSSIISDWAPNSHQFMVAWESSNGSSFLGIGDTSGQVRKTLIGSVPLLLDRSMGWSADGQYIEVQFSRGNESLLEVWSAADLRKIVELPLQPNSGLALRPPPIWSTRGHDLYIPDDRAQLTIMTMGGPSRPYWVPNLVEMIPAPDDAGLALIGGTSNPERYTLDVIDPVGTLFNVSREVTSGTPHSPFWVQWSDDNTALNFLEARDISGHPTIDLMSFSIAARHREALVRSVVEGPYSRGKWSVFVQDNGTCKTLRAIDLRSRQVVSSPWDCWDGTSDASAPAFTQGGQIAWLNERGFDSIGTPDQPAVLVSADENAGELIHSLVYQTGGKTFWIDLDTRIEKPVDYLTQSNGPSSVAPDGGSYTFSTTRTLPHGNLTSVFLVTAGHPIELYSEISNFAPSWSPDRQLLAVVNWPTTNLPADLDIYRRSDGQLVSHLSPFDGDWSSMTWTRCDNSGNE